MPVFDSSSYSEYLRSEEWQRIRNAFFQEERQCLICGTKYFLVAHHRDYKDMNNPNLAPLCQGCHEKLHHILNDVHSRINLLDLDGTLYDNRSALVFQRERLGYIFAEEINKQYPFNIGRFGKKNSIASNFRHLYIDYYDSFNRGPFGYYFNERGRIIRDSLIPGFDHICKYLIK